MFLHAPQPLYSSLAALDERCIKHYGIAGTTLMERAGEVVASHVMTLITKQFEGDLKPPVIILCGPGNNGGDGLVVARRLYQQGITSVRVVLMQLPDAYRGDAAVMMEQLQAETPVVPVQVLNSKMGMALPETGVVIDALLGTGLSRKVEGILAQVIAQINEWRQQSGNRLVLSVDIPSGIASDTGQMYGVAIQADATVTFEAEKVGHWLGAGKTHRGQLQTVSIGFPESLFHECPPQAYRISQSLASQWLPAINPQAHKYQKGHVAVLAGSEGMTGAANLVCQSVLHSGCGVATWVGPSALLSQGFLLPEVLTASTDERDEVAVMDDLKQVGAVVMGPGCGHRPEWVNRFKRSLDWVVSRQIPCVVDADGLSALAEWDIKPDESDKPTLLPLPESVVLTPHVGEAVRLLQCSSADVLFDLVGSAQAIQQQYGGVVVLKAASMVIATKNQLWINPTGDSVLGTAGSGDVLAGLISSLMAQGSLPWQAAVLGPYLQGLVGEALAQRPSGPYGVSASTLLEALPVVLNQVRVC